MNITEANAVNGLLDWLLADPDDPAVPTDVPREAVTFLARRAHEALSAGWTAEDAAEAIERLDFPGWVDDEPVEFRPVDDVVSDRLVDPDGPQSPADYRRTQSTDTTQGRRIARGLPTGGTP